MKSDQAISWRSIECDRAEFALRNRDIDAGATFRTLDRGTPEAPRRHDAVADQEVGECQRSHPVPQAWFVHNAYRVAPPRLSARGPSRVLTVGDSLSPFGDIGSSTDSSAPSCSAMRAHPDRCWATVCHRTRFSSGETTAGDPRPGPRRLPANRHQKFRRGFDPRHFPAIGRSPAFLSVRLDPPGEQA
jgi:hypothetical protein